MNDKKKPAAQGSTAAIVRLLVTMEKETQNMYKHSADRALYCLLNGYKDSLPPLDDYFHKSFRNSDVTDSPHVDNAIWYLLQNSNLFWRIFESLQQEKAT